VVLPFLGRNLDISATTPIKHLHLHAYELDKNAINFIVVLQSSLSWLDLQIEQWGDAGEGVLRHALSRMSKLQHLAVDAQYMAHYPFMDEILPRLPTLQYVHYSYGTWSAALFIAIPPTLDCLSLQGSLLDSFPIDAALDAIHHIPAKWIHLHSIILAAD